MASAARPRTSTENDYRGTFIGLLDLDFDVHPDAGVVKGQTSLSPGMWSRPGRPCLSVLLTVADCIAGASAMQATTPQLAVTLDMALHLVAEPPGSTLDVTARVVKQGRSTVATEVRFLGADTDQLVALGYLTFMASPRPEDASPPVPRGMHVHGTLVGDFAGALGLDDRGSGIVEVPRRPFVVQAAGSVQGGVVALLGEVAAESLAGRPVVDLDLRFLAAIRVGPGRATASWLGDDLIRVEIRDVGRGNRLAALTIARLAPGGPS